ncbi:LOW QUALITY PROTEIN: hypothetical protein OSB04_un001592 [Centaurea solstitialis]|uniref:Uncharacterized protein n=1 Tax=Centaurea solstitialis TaxID=347529 RepID=A0AA38S311_9ASTR|nr:LOW QUALITY PROTEIN: hypothetical protein OSB04_un001592 [Centaurea solstitialis]
MSGYPYSENTIQQKTEKQNPLLFYVSSKYIGVNSGIAVNKQDVWIDSSSSLEIGSAQEMHLPSLVISGVPRKRPGRNMAFKLSSELVGCCQREWRCLRKRERDSLEWQRQ